MFVRGIVTVVCTIVFSTGWMETMSQTITRAEYWIDVDPGWGMGVPLTNFTNGQDISFSDSILTGLSVGPHIIGIRTMGSNEKWSHTNFLQLRILPAPPEPVIGIVEVEYFWNADPYFGQSVLSVEPAPVAPVVNTLQYDLTFPDSAQLGEFHYLFARSKNSENRWSHTNFIDSVEVTGNLVSLGAGGTSYSLYPNPSNSDLWIVANDVDQNTRVQILDANGRLLVEEKVNQGKQHISVSKLTAGLYLMRILNDNEVVCKPWIKNSQ